MSKLTKKELKRYRQVLNELQERLRSDASATMEQARGPSGGQTAGELSNAPLHLGDTGTDEFLYDMNATLLENEQYLLREALDAERRIDEGKYGLCEECGRPIRKERLDAIPYARFCVKCAEKSDVHPAIDVDTGRPHTPRDTIAPEGEMQEDRPARPRPNTDPEFSRDVGGDIHAAGTAGGGTALGGLAGTNIGHGDPTIYDLQDEAGSGNRNAIEARGDRQQTPTSGRSGGAVGGTPAGKRAK